MNQVQHEDNDDIEMSGQPSMASRAELDEHHGKIKEQMRELREHTEAAIQYLGPKVAYLEVKAKIKSQNPPDVPVMLQRKAA